MQCCFSGFRSTDSELKLWDRDSGQCQRTYKGHVNKKNFVGLAVSSDFIACGEKLQASDDVVVLCTPRK